MTHKESHYMHDKQNTSLRDKSMVNAIHVLCIVVKLMRSDIWIEMSTHQIFRIVINIFMIYMVEFMRSKRMLDIFLLGAKLIPD